MKMIIDGKKTDSIRGERFDIIAPATGKVIDSVPKATAEDIDISITAAVKAQKEWKNVPIYKRADILYKFLDIV